MEKRANCYLQCLDMEATNYLVWPIRDPPNLEIAVLRGATWRLNRAGVQIRGRRKRPRTYMRNRESDTQATWSLRQRDNTYWADLPYLYVSDQCSVVLSLAHASVISSRNTIYIEIYMLKCTCEKSMCIFFKKSH